MAQNPIVTFEIEMETDFGTQTGTIKAELYPEIAPNTVNNFLSLATITTPCLKHSRGRVD